ncbi:hypothetical protein [Saccharopolyspora griseoalba]|uniref:Uncharacterized protein n=1 Tax=Saccharopolyspora griseoalba TaxID=1431848 RepID=A0ABW2LSP0_9PSEU
MSDVTLDGMSARPQQVDRVARRIARELGREPLVEQVHSALWHVVVEVGSVWASAEVKRKTGQWKWSGGRLFVAGEERASVSHLHQIKELLDEHDQPQGTGLITLVEVVEDPRGAPMPVRYLVNQHRKQIAASGTDIELRLGKDTRGRWVIALDRPGEDTGLRVPFEHADGRWHKLRAQAFRNGVDVSEEVNTNVDAAMETVFGSSGPQVAHTAEGVSGVPHGPAGNTGPHARTGTVMRT